MSESALERPPLVIPLALLMVVLAVWAIRSTVRRRRDLRAPPARRPLTDGFVNPARFGERAWSSKCQSGEADRPHAGRRRAVHTRTATPRFPRAMDSARLKCRPSGRLIGQPRSSAGRARRSLSPHGEPDRPDRGDHISSASGITRWDGSSAESLIRELPSGDHEGRMKAASSFAPARPETPSASADGRRRLGNGPGGAASASSSGQ